jgi:predicted RNase H-like nuclease (RuvC/YqgF family)
MRADYSASDFGPDEVVTSNTFISTYTSKEDFVKLNRDVELLANDSSKHLNVLQSEIHTNKKTVFKLKEDVDVSVNALESELNYISAKIYKNKAIADEQIEKLQKELQEFKKATNEFQRHLTGVSIILSVAVVFILILISFYTKL